MTRTLRIFFRPTVTLIPLALLGADVGSVVAAEPARRPLSMTEAIDVATKDGPQARSAALGITASEMRVGGAGAQRYPSLKADANLQFWDKALDVPFAGGTSFRARDQLTWQASLTLAQPISGLLVLSRLVAMEKNGEDAARADHAQARLDAGQRAAVAYLQLLQAKASETVAAKSLEQFEAQLARAQILEKGGVLGRVDVLRLTAARENARQALLRTRSGIALATAALGLALDYPQGTPIDVVDDLPDPPPPLTWRDEDVAQMATASGRPDIIAARQRGEQALAGREIAKAKLMPNITAVGTYQHIEGQSVFQPKNAWFVGGVLSWDIWDWGKNWKGVKEAEAKAGQATIGIEVMEKQLMFEARRTLLDARTAYETVASARAALDAAEEAHRIQTVRYQQGAATTTDVIAAETDLSNARVGQAQARYGVYLAQAALAKAVGKIPSTQMTADMAGERTGRK